jgi:predicted Zn finger-like uncharacterized protein
MLLTCPHCGFSRQVEAARIPEKALRVTCPRCRQGFPFSRDETGRSETAEPVVSPPVAAGIPPAAAGVSTSDAAAAANAGFWIRVVASLLDMLALGLLESALGSLLIRISGLEPGFHSREGLMIMLTVASFGVVLGYAYRVFFIGYCGQTPGKMAVQVKVIRTNGAEVGYVHAFLREVVGKFLSKLILGIGYLMVAVDSRKQGLHDKIADTYVIKLQG